MFSIDLKQLICCLDFLNGITFFLQLLNNYRKGNIYIYTLE